MAKEDIIARAKADGVEFIRLQFTDIMGTLKSLFITSKQLDKALSNKCMFDGSSVEGFVRIEESDMYLYPDESTYCVLPIDTEGGKEARMICDVYTTSGEPFCGDPRYVLRRAIQRAKDMGYSASIGPECEFFMFKLDDDGNPTTQPVDDAGYFDLDPVDRGAAARKEMCALLEQMNFEVEAAHHECGRGQHEIGFKYADPLAAADNIMTLKMVVKVVARKHGLHATFMPKPLYNAAGSGMHTNISLWQDGKNAFYDPNSELGLSTVAHEFIAGIMHHARALTAVTNPTVNSYKRLVPGYEAPVHIAWSAKNRSPLIRVPAATGNSTRVELRSPDLSCNPYLAFALMLHAGLDGVQNKMEAPPAVDANIYAMDVEERREYCIDSLPSSLRQALVCLDNDAVMKDALGDHILSRFCAAKRLEYEDYSRNVHDWEHKRYFNL
ncbi:type I glutamate--ammonia ligase [Eubacteriales bacterium OttesenSCG-928-N14]|nr:type I glutamate--ammonia ligase [Eubacteriales bacterium OttesenSCG-928-N14]